MTTGADDPSAGAGLVLRRALASDLPFLREMLYESLFVPEGAPPFDRDVVTQPGIARYVEGWGRPGDVGFVAEDAATGEPAGAAWVRLLGKSEDGYGFVDARTPELAIAVVPERRGRGVGSALLRRLLDAAGAAYDAVSLSVSRDNPAVRLYERFGFEPVRAGETSITMLKRLPSRPEEAPLR